MNKYLIFILIGIILFILNNSINSFSIGVPEYHFISGVLQDQEEDRMFTIDNDVFELEPLAQVHPIQYFVYGKDENDARRKLKRHIDLNNPGNNNIIQIELKTHAVEVDSNNKENITCNINYNCSLVNNFLHTSDECFSYCGDDENCKNYHTNELCTQNCSFVNVNISKNPDGTFTLDKTLEKDGFQIFPRLVNVNSNHINFNEVYENHILFSEYIFMKFLERMYPGSNSHKKMLKTNQKAFVPQSIELY